MKPALVILALALMNCACAAADDPSTYDQRFGMVATDTSGWGHPLMPFQGPQFFDAVRTAWWYNYLPSQTSSQVPGLVLFWPGYQRLYMFWNASASLSDAAIQSYAAQAKAKDPTRTIWWAMSNEPNCTSQSNVTGTKFAPIYLKYHKNLRIGDPTCKIIGASTVAWTYQGYSIYQSGKVWYEELRNAWSLDPTCTAYSQSVNGTNYPPQDGFNIHAYHVAGWPSDWRWCRDDLIACHNDLQTYPEAQGLKLWITEWGDLYASVRAQAGDMLGGLGHWMMDTPWIERWFFFINHSDKNGVWPNMELLVDDGTPNQLGRAYRDLQLQGDAPYYHFPYTKTWDQAAAYTRPGWTSATAIGENFGSPGTKWDLANGTSYTAHTMRGRKYQPTNGYIYRARFNYYTNYDPGICTFQMDTPNQQNFWSPASGWPSNYVEVDFSSDPVQYLTFGLYINSDYTYTGTTGDWTALVANLTLLTCPNAPVVTDGGSWTADHHRLTATWTAPSGGKQPITGYEYAIGTSPKAADVVPWTATAATSVDRSDLDLNDGVVYYISVRATDSAGHVGGTGCSDGIQTMLSSAAAVKKLPSQAPAGLQDQVVSAVFPDCIYVQDADRLSGMKVKGIAGVSPGTAVRVTGTAVCEGQEALLKNAVLAYSSPGTEPEPLSLSNRDTAGAACGLQPAAMSYSDRIDSSRWAVGANTTGLLVKTFGRVTYVDPSSAYCYIDDGSRLSDGSTHIGIKVNLDYGPIPAVGSYAVVIGCCSAFDQGGACARLLRPRRPSDASFSSVVSYLANAGFERGSLLPWVINGTGLAVRTTGWMGVYPHSGNAFAGVFVPRVLHNGTLLQTASVAEGVYSASVWSSIQHPATSDPEITKNRIGLDPTGGTDPGATTVAWSDWDTTTDMTLTPWRQIATPAVSVSGGPVTVFLQYWQQDVSKNHINCFDDAALSSQ